MCRKTAQIKTAPTIDLFPDASALIAQQQEEIRRQQLPWQSHFNPSPSQPHRRRQRVRNGGKRRATQPSG